MVMGIAMSTPGLQPPPPSLPSSDVPWVIRQSHGTSGSRPLRCIWWLPKHLSYQTDDAILLSCLGMQEQRFFSSLKPAAWLSGSTTVVFFALQVKVALRPRKTTFRQRHRGLDSGFVAALNMKLFDYSETKKYKDSSLASFMFQGRNACITVYVVSEGITVLCLDAIEALQMQIQGASLQRLPLTPGTGTTTPTLPSDISYEYERCFGKKHEITKVLKQKVKVRESVPSLTSSPHNYFTGNEGADMLSASDQRLYMPPEKNMLSDTR
ncbi:hypothetical protein HPB50_002973 [Hyalomma asiaticum]|uniref:Uncharacterized protein n=1 Tax=Hyalomma asiaticum TaxID=266040 RepID=A0ACB7TBB0_HYAAI|nr:hypothetical protein HPB50_002973 [Hyalomma asiaticum]